MVEQERIEYLNNEAIAHGGSYVLYWMQAAQRAEDNPALWHACEQANRLGLPLAVLFVLTDYPSATAVLYRWMLAGLRQVAGVLRVYSRAAFESAATHEPYWNAAQTQLIRTGTIHNYMRMYWGKMILA
jgi:deoxyribodipyrimidine photolyase